MWTGDASILIEHCYVKGSDVGTTFEIAILKFMKERPIL